MSTHDKIELPPLPVPRTKTDGGIELFAEYSVREYARAAIEPYKQRIEELESQLEAIGAGGVSSQQITSSSRSVPVACFKCGNSKHDGECVNVAPQPAESHVDRANRIVDSWPEWKRNYALTKHDVKPTQPAEPVKVPGEDERSAQGLPPYTPRKHTEEEWRRLTENGRKAWGEKDTEPVRVPSKLSNAEIMSLAYDVGAMPEQMTDGSLLTFARALLARYGQPVEPEGWQLVPKEPTEEMLAATSWPNCAGTDYKHMLASAPKFGEEND